MIKGRINGPARMDWFCKTIMSIERQQWTLSGGIIDMGKKWNGKGKHMGGWLGGREVEMVVMVGYNLQIERMQMKSIIM